MAGPTNNCKVRFQNVWRRFRRIRRRANTLQEIVVRLLRGRQLVRDLEALKGVSFEVYEGETLGIIGRNGSGKSTILKIIARVFPPSSGTVEVNGRVSPLIELGAGFHPDLSGRDNVILAGVLMGSTRREMEEKLERILAFAELEEFAYAPLRTYSSGMHARLGFSVATEIDPDILLVDEVLAVGDEAFQEKCLERMNNFRQQRKTMIFVSHAMDQVRSICDRVLLLNDGEVVTEGPPEPVIARYRELLQHLGEEASQRRGRR